MRRLLLFVSAVCVIASISAATASAQEQAAGPLSPDKERALKPKDSFKECDACPEMVVVPAGSFTMGSPASEKERASDVFISQDPVFWETGQTNTGKFILSNPQLLNSYSYAADNPINGKDADGRLVELVSRK